MSTRAPRSSARQTAALVAGGVAVVSLAAAGYFGLRTRSLVREARTQCYPEGGCEQGGIDLLNRASRAETTGFVLGGLGVASAVAAGILLVTGADQTSGNSVVVSAAINPVGVFARARW